jgi:hypothetical protein
VGGLKITLSTAETPKRAAASTSGCVFPVEFCIFRLSAEHTLIEYKDKSWPTEVGRGLGIILLHAADGRDWVVYKISESRAEKERAGRSRRFGFNRPVTLESLAQIAKANGTGFRAKVFLKPVPLS